MNLQYILFIILGLIQTSLSFFDELDDLFDSDSGEIGFGDYSYYDYFFPQRRYAAGLCYFRLNRAYFYGDFDAIIHFDGSTSGLTVKTSGFLAHSGRNNGMTYNIINFKLLTNSRLCIRFEFSYFGNRKPQHSCHQILPTTSPTMPTTTTEITEPPSVLTTTLRPPTWLTTTTEITKPTTLLTTTLRPSTEFTSKAYVTSPPSTTTETTTVITSTRPPTQPDHTTTTQSVTTGRQTTPTKVSTTMTTTVGTSAMETSQSTTDTQRTTKQQTTRQTTTRNPTTSTLPTRPPLPDPAR